MCFRSTIALLVAFLSTGLAAMGRARGTAPSFSKRPLTFEPESGGASGGFVARGPNYTVRVRRRGLDVSLSGRSSVVMEFVGAEPSPVLSAFDRKAGETNYFFGSDPSVWRTHVPNFGGVRERGLFPGIDGLFHANGGNLEYDFVVSPHADPKRILLRMRGQKKLTIGKDGSLILSFSDGDLVLQAPRVYQETKSGGTERVEGKFVLAAADEAGLQLGHYDPARPLVIDPVLDYSTYIAGSKTETASGVAVDSAGNVYVTGITTSADFPTISPEQNRCGPSTPCGATFLTKFTAAGSVVYSTYLGGDGGGNYGLGIAVDPNGNAIISGTAGSSDFPLVHSYTTFSGFTTTYAFVMSISSDGARLNYSSLLGKVDPGPVAVIVAADRSGAAYVTGQTGDSAFPVTTGVLGPSFPSYPAETLFVTKLASDGTILYSTPVPGLDVGTLPQVNNFIPKGIAIDSAGDAFLGGQASAGLPTTSGVISPTLTGPYSLEGFVFELNPSASAFVYSTYLANTVAVTAVAPDSNGGLYAGGTAVEVTPGTTGFVTTPGAFESHIPTGPNCTCNAGFIAHLNAQASAYLAATYLTGTPAFSNGGTNIMSLGLDISGSIWAGGATSSPDFPLIDPIVAKFPSGNAEAGLVTELTGDLTAALFSTFMAGTSGTNALFLAPAGAGVVWAAGTTEDTDFPTTGSAFEPALPTILAGSSSGPHAFASKIDASKSSSSLCLSATSVRFPVTVINAESQPEAISITNCGTLPLHVQNVTISSPYFSQTNTCGSPVQPKGECSISFVFMPLGNSPAESSATAVITDDASFTPQLYLSGISIPDFSVAPITTTSNTATVRTGQTANYALSVTGETDYNGEVVVHCQQVPANYTCNLSQVFLQVQAGVATDFTISVAPVPSAASLLGLGASKSGRTLNAAFALLGLSVLALLTLSTRRISKPFPRALALAIFYLWLGGTFAIIAGCGGNLGGPGGAGASRPSSQTYTLEIMVSDVNLSHTAPITLTVEP